MVHLARQIALLLLLPSVAQAFIWPGFGGVITQTFHPPAHEGIDIACGNHDPVYASAAGVITFAGSHPIFGKLIEITHQNGWTTRYAHNENLLDSKKGNEVHEGETIAICGSTGRSTGPHLHFETRLNGKPIDPESVLDRDPLNP